MITGRSKGYNRLCVGLSLVAGLLAGWADFNNDEPQAAAFLLLVFTALPGLLQPRKAWLWALLAALCLPALYIVAPALGYIPLTWPSPSVAATLLALVPAFAGAYGGALIGTAIRAMRAPDSR